uniref:GED domain-containing protein n=1 Tax=Panagrolaimus davidi TaxID=227884 RepID=A0A914PXJ0_9BILA
MMKLVNFVKDNIHRELVKKIKALGNEMKDLTAESQLITQQREQTAAKIEDLETAKTLLQNITEINVM